MFVDCEAKTKITLNVQQKQNNLVSFWSKNANMNIELIRCHFYDIVLKINTIHVLLTYLLTYLNKQVGSPDLLISWKVNCMGAERPE